MTRPTSEIPASVIDGFLEVTIGAMNSGIELGDPVRDVLDEIERREDLLVRRLNRRMEKQQVVDGERFEIALHNLGSIAAINRLLDRPDTANPIGFNS